MIEDRNGLRKRRVRDRPVHLMRHPERSVLSVLVNVGRPASVKVVRKPMFVPRGADDGAIANTGLEASAANRREVVTHVGEQPARERFRRLVELKIFAHGCSPRAFARAARRRALSNGVPSAHSQRVDASPRKRSHSCTAS